MVGYVDRAAFAIFLGCLGCTQPCIFVASLQSQPAAAAVTEIAYIANDFHSIHLVQADGSADQQLVSAIQATVGDIAWSPDGKLLAYTTFLNDPQAQASQRMYLLDTSNGRVSELKSSIGSYGPIAFFPDGKRLVTMSGRGPTVMCGGQVIAIDAQTGKAAPLAQAGPRLSEIQVAPDSSALIATTHGGDPSSSISIVSLSSGAATDIVGARVDYNTLAFSGIMDPAGDALAYVQTAFTVSDVTLDTPGHATVHTHETWYTETNNRATGQLFQRTPPTSYDEDVRRRVPRQRLDRHEERRLSAVPFALGSREQITQKSADLDGVAALQRIGVRQNPAPPVELSDLGRRLHQFLLGVSSPNRNSPRAILPERFRSRTVEHRAWGWRRV